MRSVMMRTALVLGCLWMLVPTSAVAQLQNPVLPGKRQLQPFGLERMWWNQAVINPLRDKVTFIVVDEDNVYVQTSANIITCFNAQTGAKTWSQQVGARNSPMKAVTSNESIVLAVDALHMYAIDKFTGRRLWQLRLPATPASSAAIDGDRVYFGSLTGAVYAFDLVKVRDLYGEGMLPEWTYQTQVWYYKAAKEVRTAPVATGRSVLFASMDGTLHSVTSGDRKPLFMMELDSPISAPLARDGDYMYFASEDFNFYCININNGSVLWEFITGLPVRKGPIVINEHVFVAPESGGLFAIDKLTGRRRWWKPRLTEFLAATPNRVYASEPSGQMVVVDRTNGATLGAVPLQNFEIRVRNDRTDRIYMATESGRVICLAETNREFPLYYRYPERRPILPDVPQSKPASEPEETANP